MKLSDFLRELKVRGEVILSVEDVKKMITCEDDFSGVQTLHIAPPISAKIIEMYEKKDKGGNA